MSPSSKAQPIPSSDKEARYAMKELGFSEEECSIFFDLLAKPEGEAIETILTHSKGPSGKAEDAVKGLVDKGLVKIRSNKLEIAEPKISLSKLQEARRLEMSREMETLTITANRLAAILDPQYWEARLGVKPEDLLEPLPSLEEMELQTIRILANASRDVAISAENFSWFDKVREEIERGLDRGVRFRVLMKVKDDSTTQRMEELQRMKILVRESREEWYPVRGTLCDDKELVFLIWTGKESEIERPKFYRPHYTKNPGMIRVFADAFERRWGEAGKT
jgi:sugar-specific transcriptional regulator TrmB